MAQKLFASAQRLFGIGLALLFVMLGIYLFSVKADDPATAYPEVTRWVGIVCAAFFGFVLIAGCINLFRTLKNRDNTTNL